MNINNSLIEKLKLVRNSSITMDEFHNWFKSNAYLLENLFSRGVFLKLEKGDSDTLMKVLIELSTACAVCVQIYRTGLFSDRNEFNTCNSIVGLAIASNKLKRVDKPVCVNSKAHPFAVSAYYRCQNCESIWELAAPEREFVGFWNRVG
ncbi:hypothetical protein [Vibrio gazogenes]|uniref:Uncharacterized protein n=1 Tax=Vibrio gazogenes TaxID=687 RepID=A0A1Z2SLA6_VIBGA|nr:hypothetical protein [Vibrio gazogenes]ASA57929.1 hypothetical protein BSQ33_19665 [Vibrio gazogenes]